MTRKGTHILGISAFYHDSAACLVRDGAIVAAAQEERFTRKKHDASFPVNAVRYCLEAGGIEAGDLDHVGFYDKPFVKFERLISTYVDFFPRGLSSFVKAIPVWLREKLWIKHRIQEELKKWEVLQLERQKRLEAIKAQKEREKRAQAEEAKPAEAVAEEVPAPEEAAEAPAEETQEATSGEAEQEATAEDEAPEEKE